MDRFRGSAPATVDEKGRLKIPNLFRERIREAYGPELFVSSLHGREVLVYPLAEWHALEERLAAAPAIHRAKTKFLERVNYFGQDAEMDSQGRVLIPALLRETAHFGGEVVVTGNINHLVVTDRKSTADRIAAEDFTAEDYDELSKLLL
jgi:transcriptional regulator MraZ